MCYYYHSSLQSAHLSRGPCNNYRYFGNVKNVYDDDDYDDNDVTR